MSWGSKFTYSLTNCNLAKLLLVPQTRAIYSLCLLYVETPWGTNSREPFRTGPKIDNLSVEIAHLPSVMTTIPPCHL